MGETAGSKHEEQTVVDVPWKANYLAEMARETTYLPPILGMIKHPVIFEIGAHIGTSTCKILSVAPDAIYYAFEPDIRNLRILWSLFQGPDIHIISKAVGKVDGKIKFWASSGINKVRRVHTDSSSIKEPVAHAKMFPWMRFEETTCECIQLDTFIQVKGIDHIDLIWADIQGAELDMIEGGKEALRRTHWLYTEHMDKPRYKGQPNLSQIMKALPGKWRIAVKFTMDALLENEDYAGPSIGT